MRILSIETSCDETAVAVIEAEGGFDAPQFRVISHNLYSQAEKHAEFGGVYPNLAKREHSRNLVPILKKTLEESGFGSSKSPQYHSKADYGARQAPNTKQSLNPKLQKTQLQHSHILQNVRMLLERNPELQKQFLEYLPTIDTPDIDAIVVTEGPGLEPALWVGINFAQALGEFWDKPVIGVNHMEGHIFSVLANGKEFPMANFQFPILSLLISGGHTELVLVKNWREYEILGQTRDDAVGEAFDKTARVLGLPYPGGPEISRLADLARIDNLYLETQMPRPMMNSADFDFSFSGLKTAVLYYEKENGPLDEDHKMKLAREIEDAISDVLIEKTRKALKQTGTKTLIVAGGVIANKFLRENFEKLVMEEFPDINLRIPTQSLSTDNAVMIGIAGYFKILNKGLTSEDIKARGALRLAS